MATRIVDVATKSTQDNMNSAIAGINTNIGTSTDVGGSTSAGTVMAKLNNIQTQVSNIIDASNVGANPATKLQMWIADICAYGKDGYAANDSTICNMLLDFAKNGGAPLVLEEVIKSNNFSSEAYDAYETSVLAKLAAGEYPVGTVVWFYNSVLGTYVPYDVIGLNMETAGVSTLQARYATTEDRFAQSSIQYGQTFANTSLYSYLNNTYINGFRDATKAAIKTVTKKFGPTNNTGWVDVSTRMFLLNTSQLNLSTERGTAGGTPYPVYPTRTNAASKDKIERLEDGTPVNYWTSDVSLTSGSAVYTVNSIGSVDLISYTSRNYFLPTFVI